MSGDEGGHLFVAPVRSGGGRHEPVSGRCDHWPMQELSPRDRVILTFEDTHTGFSPTRYFQLLSDIIDTPAALVENPMLVKRLLHDRHRRVNARASRRFDTA